MRESEAAMPGSSGRTAARAVGMNSGAWANQLGVGSAWAGAQDADPIYNRPKPKPQPGPKPEPLSPSPRLAQTRRYAHSPAAAVRPSPGPTARANTRGTKRSGPNQDFSLPHESIQSRAVSLLGRQLPARRRARRGCRRAAGDLGRPVRALPGQPVPASASRLPPRNANTACRSCRMTGRAWLSVVTPVMVKLLGPAGVYQGHRLRHVPALREGFGLNQPGLEAGGDSSECRAWGICPSARTRSGRNGPCCIRR